MIKYEVIKLKDLTYRIQFYQEPYNPELGKSYHTTVYNSRKDAETHIKRILDDRKSNSK